MLLGIAAVPRPEGNRLALTALVILLAVYLVADLTRGAVDHLLPPPPDYDEEYRESPGERGASAP